jgi:hypothetical protein
MVMAGVVLSAYVASGFSRTVESPAYVASGFSRTVESPAYVVSAFRRTVTQAEMTRVPQFENERAVSWKSVIPPHTESTLHRHDRFRTVIGIVGGDLTTVSADGQKTVTRYQTGKAYFQSPMPPGEMHKDVNETNKVIELIVVEMK